MTTSDEVILLDTNVLVYAADKLSPFHEECRTYRDRGRSGEFSLCGTPQVLFELYAVITDPKRVSQPLDTTKALEELSAYQGDQAIKKI